MDDQLIKWLPVFFPFITSLILMYLGFKLKDKREFDKALLSEVKEIKESLNRGTVMFAKMDTEIEHLKEGYTQMGVRVDKLEQKIDDKL